MPDATRSSGEEPKSSSLIAFPHEHTARRPLHNLPLQLSSFVGREREIAKVKSLLTGNRLLTLTGPGGCGKTRLALKVAFEVVEDFEEGMWWVGLASLSDPDLVPQAAAQALGVREQPGRPLAQTLVEALRPRQMLLVLDNCEHLIEACIDLAGALVRSCPNLSVLATSRETLGITGEVGWPVPPLSLPDRRLGTAAEGPLSYESVRLFVERAVAVDPSFELSAQNAPAVARVCHRLDGIPLAIEFAAARAKVLTVEQIAGRLDESFGLLASGDRTALPHHRTLRATMEWSHELLSEEERVFFRRLSVFPGGFTLGAAEAVCAGGAIEEEGVLDLLACLVDKSIVVAARKREGEARYRLLETVRQYGREKLEEAGEAERVQERHARYYLALAEETEPELREQGAGLERLGTEHANLRVALSWALDPEETAGESAELGLRLAAALAQGRFWNASGPSEGRWWLERGLARSGASPPSVRAKALSQAGFIAGWQGDYQRSAALLEEGMVSFKELGDKPGVATSLVLVGQSVLFGGDRERARELRREAEALRGELADRQATGLLLYFLGLVALNEGEHDRAVALAEEGLALNRELGDLRGTAMCLTVLGVTALDRRDPERAAALYEEDLRALRGLRDKTGTAFGLRGMACVAALRGDGARAARLWGAAEVLGEAIGLPISPFDRSHPDYEGLLNAARSRLGDEAAWEAAWSEGRAMTPEEAIEYAMGTATAPPSSPLPKDKAALSARELEVLRLVAEGLTDSQVAERLYLSPRTVNHHLSSIYRKLGVPSRAAAAKEASKRDLI